MNLSLAFNGDLESRAVMQPAVLGRLNTSVATWWTGCTLCRAEMRRLSRSMRRVRRSATPLTRPGRSGKNSASSMVLPKPSRVTVAVPLASTASHVVLLQPCVLCCCSHACYVAAAMHVVLLQPRHDPSRMSDSAKELLVDTGGN